MRIVIEIGSNNGEDTTHLLDGADKLYACEPDPALINQLMCKFSHDPKFTLWPYAIDLTEEEKTFHIMSHERGINSLYPLHENLLDTPLQKHWQYQQGMTDSITVQTRRLDTLVKKYEISHIDFMWIDAQGNDLIVLKSLGEHIHILRAGRMECTYKVPIYDGVDNSYESCVAFLEENHFKHKIDYTHQDESEVDVSFWREENNYDEHLDSDVQ